MLAETPNPTPQQVRENGHATTPRSSRIVREVVRRLRLGLPPLIEAENADNGWDGVYSGVAPVAAEGVRLAPAFFDARFKNTISATWSYQSQPLAGLVFKQRGSLLVFSLDDVFEDDAQIERSFDRIELVQMFLGEFTAGCVAPGGVTVWRTLEHLSTSLIPPEIANGYAGAMASFDVKLTPRANGR